MVNSKKMKSFEVILKDSKNFPGTRSAFYWWKNDRVPGSIHKGYVWINHGVGEHMGRYDELARFLTQFGYDVVGIDLPGHGLSKTQGKQKQLIAIDGMLDEIKSAFIYWNVESPVAEKLKDKPWHLFAHSMGTILSLKWIIDGNIDLLKKFPFAKNAFLSSPPLKLQLEVPAWKNWLAGKLEYLAPHLALSNEISIDQLTHDVAIKEKAHKDPLFHSLASPELFLSMNKCVDEILSSPQSVEIPLCIAVGEEDPVCDPKGSEDYFNKLNTHKKFLKFNHFYHEIFNEVGRETIFEELIKWIEQKNN